MDFDTFYTIAKNILDAFVTHWPQILAIVGGTAGLSFATEIYKRIRKIESSKKAMAVFTTLATLASLVPGILDGSTTVFGHVLVDYIGIGTPLYIFIYKDVAKIVSLFISYWPQIKADTKQLESLVDPQPATNEVVAPAPEPVVEEPEAPSTPVASF